MNLQDKMNTLNYMSGIGTKGIVETYDVEASRDEIEDFIDACITHLQVAIEEGKL